MNNAPQMLDNTRQLAAQAMDRAGDTMKDWRNSAQESAAAAQRQLGVYAQNSSRYVAEHPMKTALIAAGIGAAVAGLYLAMRHYRETGKYF